MKLYIIGNGFDLAHKIPSTYTDFYKFLFKNKKNVLSIMEAFYYVKSDSELWTDFENRLDKDINYESLTEIIQQNAPNLASDDFRDRDWYDAQIYIESKCNNLLNNIRAGFEDWIQTLSLSIYKCAPLYQLDRDAYYFTFNYTETLEKIYNIPPDNILHIHNKVGEPLIFGHGEKTFDVQKALYGINKSFFEKDEFGNNINSDIGHEYFAENEVINFHEKMRKHTEDVIKYHKKFFNSISPVDEIIVMGHSYNDIDMPYFYEIAKHIKQNTQWKLYFHKDSDKKNAIKLMHKLKVKKNLWTLIHA